jgi:hypothetical protein
VRIARSTTFLFITWCTSVQIFGEKCAQTGNQQNVQARAPPRPRAGRPRRPHHVPPKTTRRPRRAPSPCPAPRVSSESSRASRTAPCCTDPELATDRRSVGSIPSYARRPRSPYYSGISAVTATSLVRSRLSKPSALPLLAPTPPPTVPPAPPPERCLLRSSPSQTRASNASSRNPRGVHHHLFSRHCAQSSEPQHTAAVTAGHRRAPPSGAFLPKLQAPTSPRWAHPPPCAPARPGAPPASPEFVEPRRSHGQGPHCKLPPFSRVFTANQGYGCNTFDLCRVLGVKRIFNSECKWLNL